jgi:SHS2 domain-containing protein
MFELMADAEPCPPVRLVEAKVEATTSEALVVDVLSEFLYLSETEKPDGRPRCTSTLDDVE